MIHLPDMNPIVSLVGRVSQYGVPYYPVYIAHPEVTIIGNSKADAEEVCNAIKGRINPNFPLVCWSQHDVQKKGALKHYDTRALVIITDRLFLKTESINELKESLRGMAAAINCPDWQVTALDLIVDIHAVRFYKR